MLRAAAVPRGGRRRGRAAVTGRGPGEQAEPADRPTPGEQAEPADRPTPGEQAEPADRPTPGEQAEPADRPTPGELASLARSIAEEAGELLLRGHGTARIVHTKSSPTDIVTDLDEAAEGLIRDRIQAARPGDDVLAEEGGQTGTGSLVRWIVDPLDGTVNYHYGLPDWSVSIAAELAGTVVAGVIAAPVRRMTYTATAGGGAWLHSGGPAGPEQLSCNAGVALADALVATGFSYLASQRAVQGAIVAGLLPRVRDIRRAGSAALDLCALAAGGVDAYFESGLHDWDLAAGSLIAREAGALVGGLEGNAAGPAMTIAAGPALFGDLHDLLAELARAAGADRVR
jgi:myo-inositol-1(or 4)-monophosphatase